MNYVIKSTKATHQKAEKSKKLEVTHTRIMEEAEEEPFWISDDRRRSGRRRRGSPANLLMSSGAMLVILIVVAGVFVFVIVPSVLKFGSQIFKPHLVKKSWDSLNLVLVAFAIVCGFLSRNGDGGGSRDLDDRRVGRPSGSTAEGGDRDRWYGGFDRTVEDRGRRGSSESTVEGGDRDRWYGGFDRTVEDRGSSYLNRMRSTRSYSDLGLVEPTERWRFHDDTGLRNRRVFGSGRDWGGGGEGRRREDPEARNVVAESFVANDTETASFAPPVPQPERAYQETTSFAPPVPQPKRAYQETTSFTPSAPPSERAYLEMDRYSGVGELRPPSPPPETAATPGGAFRAVRQRSRSEDLETESYSYLGVRNLADLRPPPETAATPGGAYRQRSRSEDLDNVGRYDGLRNFEELLPPSPPRAPAGKAAKGKAKRGKQAVVEKRREARDLEASASHAPPPAPPYPTAERSGAVAKRRGGGTKDLWIALRRKKKKKQRERSVEDLASFFSSHEPPHAPPPPPPPPPPPSIFYNLFSPRKSNKTKKSTSVPPPPPPQTAAREPKPRTLISHSQAQSVPASTRKPPLPERTATTSLIEEIPNYSNLSPLIPIPPPPPPPFTMEAWRFRRQGDFVMINSDTSSRSGSPELEDAEESPTLTATDGGEAVAALFCPSPDVDTKADTFIAQFRAGLNLEKMNSTRRSNLGPDPGPDPGPSFQ